MIYEFKGIKPEIDESVFVAPSADIIGRVKIAKGSSVWFNVTIRADVDDVIIGENVSIETVWMWCILPMILCSDYNLGVVI